MTDFVRFVLSLGVLKTYQKGSKIGLMFRLIDSIFLKPLKLIKDQSPSQVSLLLGKNYEKSKFLSLSLVRKIV